MNFKKPYNNPFLLWLLLVLTISSSRINAQNNCPFIWPLDGSTCGDCAPNGWENILTADIVDGFNWFVCPLINVGQSPTGGNSVLLYGTNNNAEAISTVVGGLTPGIVYNIGFYWIEAYTDCPGGLGFGGGDMVITIDGNVYTFSGAPDWELAEICYTAEDYIAEIHITIETNSPGLILVDSAICEELETCCELEVDVNPNSTVCPGEPFIFDGQYNDHQGAVTVEWTSEPESGIDFIDDRFSLNPTFFIPESDDYPGESFRYKLTVTDAACDRTEEFLLTVSPNEVPEFDIELCEVFTDYELPLESLDPYTGTWEGDFDFGELGGTTQEYIFTLDDGQDNCVESHVYEYYVEVAEPVIFELPEAYCGLDNDTYFIEFISDNGVEGTWDIDGISPDRLTPDFYTYIFTPDPELHCAFPYEYIFEVKEPDSLSFSLPSTFCIIQDNYPLPNVSNEGIQGEWNVEEINVSTLGTGFQIIFTPDEVQDCYYPYVHTYNVTNNIINTFDLPSSVCSNTDVFVLPIFSDQGYEGEWSPSAFSFDTISGNSIQATWTALPGQSDCLVPSTESINIEQAINVSFDLQDTVCLSSPAVSLPSFDITGEISGQWTSSNINANLLGVGDHIVEFLPDPEFCANIYTYTVHVKEEIDPTFNLVNGLCPSQNPIVLPNVSDEGYVGSWTVPIIDPSVPGTNQIQSVFIPNSNQELCLNNVTETFTIDLLIDPEFDLPNVICSNTFPLELPTTSQNGVIGNWNIPVIDENVTVLNIPLVFTPDDLSCYNVIDTDLTIVQESLITADQIDPSDCDASDGMITINTNSQSFEYSIDNGLNWTTQNTFSNLTAGNYMIHVRSLDLNTCIFEYDFDLVEPDQIEISGLDVSNITNCTTQDGEVTCMTNLANVEFSLDGVIWQIEGTFENLTSGNYNMYVRNVNGISCRDTMIFQIEDFPLTIIEMIDVTPVSECEIENGIIEITASGNALEYSIDGGVTWQSENIFYDLTEGNYNVEVRSSLSQDCIDATSVVVVKPIDPEIVDVITTNTQDCEASDGTIEIDATGSNLEYSIDGGTTYQDNSLFSNLIAGTYSIVVRDNTTMTCLVEEEAHINDPDNLILNDIQVVNATTCFLDSGEIIIDAESTVEIEYSLDGGMTWQLDNTFQNLESGSYEIMMRPVMYSNCIITEMVMLELEDQDIILLDVILNQPSDCVSNDASITFIADLNDLEYSIDNGSNWQVSNEFFILNDGDYQVLIRKPNTTDCLTDYTFTIKTPPCPCQDLTVDLTLSNVTCEAINSGSIEILDIQGLFTNEGVTVEWSNGVSGLSNQMLESGWFVYEVAYDKNCLWQDSVFVEGFDPITFGLLSFDQTCTEEGQIEVVDFSGGNGEFNFSINNNNFQEESVFYDLSPEEYQIFVMDQLGCQESESITLNSNFDLNVELSSIDPIFIDESITLNPLINQTTIDSFTWYPLTGINNPNELVAQVSPRETTEYTLTIYYGQCVEIRTIVVEVIDNRVIYVANTFSFSDRNNDIFFLQGASDLDVTIHNFLIYDRWGNLVFNKDDVPLNDTSYGWDGYFNGRKANVGVYTYFINYTLRGEPFKDAGTLTLVR